MDEQPMEILDMFILYLPYEDLVSLKSANYGFWNYAKRQYVDNIIRMRGNEKLLRTHLLGVFDTAFRVSWGDQHVTYADSAQKQQRVLNKLINDRETIEIVWEEVIPVDIWFWKKVSNFKTHYEVPPQSGETFYMAEVDIHYVIHHMDLRIGDDPLDYMRFYSNG